LRTENYHLYADCFVGRVDKTELVGPGVDFPTRKKLRVGAGSGSASKCKVRSGKASKRCGSTTPYLSSVADPGSGAFLIPGSGMGKKLGYGSGMNNLDHISQSLKNIF
jgi:hypothetical protein